MKYKDKDVGVVLTFRGHWISWAHTIVAYSTLSMTSFIFSIMFSVDFVKLTRF
jgi:hypothetical protein